MTLMLELAADPDTAVVLPRVLAGVCVGAGLLAMMALFTYGRRK